MITGHEKVDMKIIEMLDEERFKKVCESRSMYVSGICEKIKTKRLLIKEETEKLKRSLIVSEIYLNKASPQINTEDKTKSAIPKSIIKNIIYSAPYQELCLSVKNSEIPPIKLLALANLLNISYDVNISWTNLCGEVKQTLLLLL